MIICEEQSTEPLMVDGKAVEKNTQFNFLGDLITMVESCNHEVRRRMTMTRSAMANLSKIWADRGLIIATKTRLVQALFFALPHMLGPLSRQTVIVSML